MKKIGLGILILITMSVLLLDYFNLLPQRTYLLSDFEIEILQSTVDFNKNGKDDYLDFLIGALKDARNHPKYDGSYVEGGFPSSDIGVCTDVIWRAFKEAGYNLREMIHQDIVLYPDDYPHISSVDKNIDFRRVQNLHIFFNKYGISLTLDKDEIREWQAGDIVVFNNDKHIGLVSDKRDKNGVAYIIHNGGQLNREENYLKKADIMAHFRFDASKVDQNILISFEKE